RRRDRHRSGYRYRLITDGAEVTERTAPELKLGRVLYGLRACSATLKSSALLPGRTTFRPELLLVAKHSQNFRATRQEMSLTMNGRDRRLWNRGLSFAA